MRARKFVGAVLAVGCLGLALAGTGTAAPRANPAGTRITIATWPKGFFGYVRSSRAARCAAGRWVAVFRQGGRRPDPARDRRIARVRAAGKLGSYQWSVKTAKRGRLYARAANTPGCRGGNSNTVVAPGVTGNGAGGDAASYPPCGPYVSEGSTTICEFKELHLDLDQQAPFTPCRFGRDEGHCDGTALSGLFPWGRTPFGLGRPKVSFVWNWGQRSAMFGAYSPSSGNTGFAHLAGTVPNSSSPNFTIGDGFATNDLGYPNGDHFYTPDVPGQDAGEVGGPLYLNFVNGSGTDFGAEVYIRGYLYLKR